MSLTAINGLIMYLAVLKGVRGPQGGEKGGATTCHMGLKASLEKREALFVRLNGLNNIRDCS